MKISVQPKIRAAIAGGRLVWLLAACTGLVVGQGCTYRAWYEGFRERQRQECYAERGQSEMEKCLERVNSMTYEEYAAGRDNAKREAK